MPNNIIKSFAQRTGKTESEVEASWEKSKSIVSKQYPEVESGSEKFYKLITGVLKNMLSIKTENEGGEASNTSGGISYSDVKPGTYEPFSTKHKQKRNLKKAIKEAYDRIPAMSTDDLGVFKALAHERNNISITMLENAISANQLEESLGSLRLGEVNNTEDSEELHYLDSAIKEAISDKQKFAIFIEQLSGYMYKADDLNTDNIEYPGYDLSTETTLISVKSSSSKHTVAEAFRNSNSIKTSALIFGAMYRLSPDLFKEKCNFKSVTDLLKYRDTILSFSESEDKFVQFAVSFIGRDGNLHSHLTNPIKESVILTQAFDTIENATGKAKSKFCASYPKLKEMCGGDEVTIISLMNDNNYSELREQLIDTISNIKDYTLMKKIEQLLR